MWFDIKAAHTYCKLLFCASSAWGEDGTNSVLSTAVGGGGAGVAEVPQQQQHNDVNDIVQPIYKQPPSLQLSQEFIDSLDDAQFVSVLPPTVQGNKGKGKIETYSTKSSSSNGHNYGEVYCIGCMDNGDGGTCCPGNAPGIACRKIVIGGKKRAICRNCLVHIAEHLHLDLELPPGLPTPDGVVYRMDNNDLLLFCTVNMKCRYLM